MDFWKLIPLVLALGVASPVHSGPSSRPPATATASLDPAPLAELDAAIEAAIGESKLPGGVLWFEHRGAIHRRAYGHRARLPEIEPMTEDTIFDAASLTKVVATSPAILQWMERGRFGLDEPVARVLNEFAGGGRDAITFRHLLTHTSGLASGLPRTGIGEGAAAALDAACRETPLNPPGTAFRYSDINFILLGAVVERLSGESLDAYCRREVFGPLRMKDTHFRPLNPVPPGAFDRRIAPTERLADGTVLRAVVHDPTARRMGGIAGHAGVFTTASDLARFARMLLGKGALEGTRVLRPESVALMTGVQSPAGIQARRGLGWDIDSPYSGPRGGLFPIGSFGHTGWTGTSLWIDPASESFVIFLSNRNHPTEDGNVISLRREIGTLAARSIRDGAWNRIEGAPPPRNAGNAAAAGFSPDRRKAVLNGIDVLVRDEFRPLRGLKLGLVTNHTGRDREGRSTALLLKAAPGVRLEALFSPEHGLRGSADDRVPDGTDPETGLPVYSLYGETHAPRPSQLKGLDALVFDIQDIGCRYYTYSSTMGHCLEACAANQVRFIVLDRINPINGQDLDGPVMTAPRSFVGWHEIPVRHGMTLGELARFYNAERRIGALLEVIRCDGWRRELWQDQTSLPWMNPSPNIRSLAQATLYPGIGWLEFCQLSVGRGTDTPFEIIGAPYIDGAALGRRLDETPVPGVRFEPVRFTPRSSKFEGKECQGVRIHVSDRATVRLCEIGLVVAGALQSAHGADLGLDRALKLIGDAPTLEAIRAGRSRESIRAGWSNGLADFQRRREPHLLY